PFQAETPLETLRQVRELEPMRPRALNPHLDRDLEAVCLKCLEKEPSRRYASAQDLADDLERWLRAEPVRARRHRLWQRAATWARRRPRTAASLAVAGLMLLAALGLGLWRWDRNRLKVEYYTGCVLREGVVEGVGRIDEKQARRRNFSFKVYRRAGQVERVEV